MCWDVCVCQEWAFNPEFMSLMALNRIVRIICFDGRQQFVVSAPCTNCRRRQFVQETTICGVGFAKFYTNCGQRQFVQETTIFGARFFKILHNKLSPTTICAGTTICGATGAIISMWGLDYLHTEGSDIRVPKFGKQNGVHIIGWYNSF